MLLLLLLRLLLLLLLWLLLLLLRLLTLLLLWPLPLLRLLRSLLVPPPGLLGRRRPRNRGQLYLVRRDLALDLGEGCASLSTSLNHLLVLLLLQLLDSCQSLVRGVW